MKNRWPITRPPAAATAMALAVLLAACATTGDVASPSPSPRSPDEAPAAQPSPTQGAEAAMPGGGIDEQTLADLVAAAAAEAGVSADEISVVTAEQVTWSDGSIGCPEPGMVYTQALVPGYRVVLDIAGDEHHFHASDRGEFFHCDDPEPPAEGGTR